MICVAPSTAFAIGEHIIEQCNRVVTQERATGLDMAATAYITIDGEVGTVVVARAKKKVESNAVIC